jgi:hypothetical protein
MVLYRSISLLTLGTILFFSPALANAKPYHHHYGYHRHYGYGYGGARWCRSDPSPRDPRYFKKADNRCTGTIRIGMGR